ncbi:hypothetical protein K0M31_004400 [Melipona bicolor]|uniref:Uncharacterized protein n=1 Tax=Melipona bicolor TaxID=60889 RepID=A0AA40FWU2_9HYME|nr:hypothetical protein K0M31_004400 [Melipona bicolor]
MEGNLFGSTSCCTVVRARALVDIVAKHASGFMAGNGCIQKDAGPGFENQASGSFSRGRNSSSFGTPGIARLHEETRDIPALKNDDTAGYISASARDILIIGQKLITVTPTASVQRNEGNGDSRRAFVGVEHSRVTCVSKSPAAGKPFGSPNFHIFIYTLVYEKSSINRA